MAKFKVIAGSVMLNKHKDGEAALIKKYTKGDVVESDLPLDKQYPGKFEKLK